MLVLGSDRVVVARMASGGIGLRCWSARAHRAGYRPDRGSSLALCGECGTPSGMAGERAGRWISATPGTCRRAVGLLGSRWERGLGVARHGDGERKGADTALVGERRSGLELKGTVGPMRAIGPTKVGGSAWTGMLPVAAAALRKGALAGIEGPAGAVGAMGTIGRSGRARGRPKQWAPVRRLGRTGEAVGGGSGRTGRSFGGASGRVGLCWGVDDRQTQQTGGNPDSPLHVFSS